MIQATTNTEPKQPIEIKIKKVLEFYSGWILTGDQYIYSKHRRLLMYVFLFFKKC